MGLLPEKVHRAKEKAGILKANGLKSFEQNVLQNFQLLKLCFFFWLIQMMQMHVCGGESINTYFTSEQFAKKYQEQFLPRKAEVTFRMTPAVLTS